MNNAELETKINRAIDVLRTNEPTGGYGLAFIRAVASCPTLNNQLLINATTHWQGGSVE